MTSEELDGLLAELRETLRDLGIPLSRRIDPHVAVNTRARRRLGCCYTRPEGFLIEVSAALLMPGREEKLRETLAHELLHTCPGCRNHGDKWKAHAETVNRALGFSIRRTAPPDPEDSGPLRQEQVHYVLECQACGRQIPRYRMSKAVRQPWRYRCPCGGRLKRIL